MSPQSCIGHYRITSKLGEGGMGAVYRATDTKLNREVAIKVLPEAFASDAERLARFTREAQVLASLNHPNIASIYGVEERALVMELVEGDSPHGPLTTEEALPVIRELIDALEYAHERGVVHRDLKPANLKLTPDGRLKVLDFGLAKALSADNASIAGDAANSPTLTMRATMAGVIIGTAAYMSPEQARGHAVDRRADIWSFGVTVFELLTGKQLFVGETVSDLLAAVLRHEPDLTNIPAPFQRLLRLCLVRDPRQRLRDISGARLLLDETGSAAPPPRAKESGSKLPWLATIVACAAALALGAGWWRATRVSERPLTRFTAELAPDGVDGPQMTAIVSPDGRRVVFRMRSPNGIVLGTRMLDQAKATVLPGTEHNSFAFFSPDSQWIGFYAGGKLKKISVQGGAPITLCDAPEPYGAAWLPDGSIIALISERTLVRVPEAGGAARPVPRLDDRQDRWPQALPSTDRILVSAIPSGGAGYENADVDVIFLKTGQRKTVLHGGYFGRYVPTGHLLYVHQGTLYGVRFDPDRLEVRGSPAPLLEEVSSFPAQGAGHFDFSLTGTLVFSTGKPYAQEQPIAVLEAGGRQEVIAGISGTSLRVSPDGKRLAFKTDNDLFVHEFGRDSANRITFDPAGVHRHPIWTPDGRHLVYAGAGGIWWNRADGSGQPMRILPGEPVPTPWSFAQATPREIRLAFHQAGQDNKRDIWILPIDVSDPDRPNPGKPEPFLTTPANEVEPVFSPDGRWLAFTAEDSGESRVYVRSYRPGMPAGGGRWQISETGGRFPVWARDGRELLFRSADGHIMAVDYTASGDSFSAGKPHPWSPNPIYMTGVFQDFDLFPDSKRAIVVALPDVTKGGVLSPPGVFLLNFFDELKRRLP